MAKPDPKNCQFLTVSRLAGYEKGERDKERDKKKKKKKKKKRPSGQALMVETGPNRQCPIYIYIHTHS
jgi:hypothetical protein